MICVCVAACLLKLLVCVYMCFAIHVIGYGCAEGGAGMEEGREGAMCMFVGQCFYCYMCMDVYRHVYGRVQTRVW